MRLKRCKRLIALKILWNSCSPFAFIVNPRIRICRDVFSNVPPALGNVRLSWGNLTRWLPVIDRAAIHHCNYKSSGELWPLEVARKISRGGEHAPTLIGEFLVDTGSPRLLSAWSVFTNRADRRGRLTRKFGAKFVFTVEPLVTWLRDDWRIII